MRRRGGSGLVMLMLFLTGVLVYILEGCAMTLEQGKQKQWEECAKEIHQDCWDTQDVLDCGYEHYRACIDGS